MPAIGNIILETGTGAGTGNLTITTYPFFRRFSDAFGIGSGNTFYYCIRHRSVDEYEVGVGYASDANTLVRSTVMESSNANTFVDFTAGDKDVISDLPASLQGLGIPGGVDGSIQFKDGVGLNGFGYWNKSTLLGGIGTTSPIASWDIQTLPALLPPTPLTAVTANYDTGVFTAGTTVNYAVYAQRAGRWSSTATPLSFVVTNGLEVPSLTLSPYYAGSGYFANDVVTRTIWQYHTLGPTDFALYGTTTAYRLVTGIEVANGTFTYQLGTGYVADGSTRTRSIWGRNTVGGYSLIGTQVIATDANDASIVDGLITWTMNTDADDIVIVNDDTGDGYSLGGNPGSWVDDNTVWGGGPIDTSGFWVRPCGINYEWTVASAAPGVVLINDDTGDGYDLVGNPGTWQDLNTVWGGGPIDTSAVWARTVGLIELFWDASLNADNYFPVNTDVGLGTSAGDVLLYGDDGTGLVDAYTPTPVDDGLSLNTSGRADIGGNLNVTGNINAPGVSTLTIGGESFLGSNVYIGNTSDLFVTRDIHATRYLISGGGIGLNGLAPGANLGIDMHTKKIGDTDAGSDSTVYFTGGGYCYYEGSKIDLALHMHNTNAAVAGYAILGARPSGGFMQYSQGPGAGFTRFRIEKSGGTLGNLAASAYEIGEIGAVKWGVASTGAMTLATGTTSVLPQKYTSGPLLTTPQAGGREFLDDTFYMTQTTNTSRHPVASNNNPLCGEVYN